MNKSYLMIWPGMETLADSTFLTCPLRTLKNWQKYYGLDFVPFNFLRLQEHDQAYHHSIAFSKVANVLGLPRRKLCMLESASMAVPSTTSITTSPTKEGINWL